MDTDDLRRCGPLSNPALNPTGANEKATSAHAMPGAVIGIGSVERHAGGRF